MPKAMRANWTSTIFAGAYVAILISVTNTKMKMR